MKFVTLALTILFATGSQARPQHNDALPSQNIRAAVGVYLQHAKETAERALEHLDDTVYQDQKGILSKSLNNLEEYIKHTSQWLSPNIDTFTAELMEATKQLRELVMTDVEELKKQLEPKVKELKQVVQKHLEEYREELEPVLLQYVAKYKQETQAIREKLQPLLEEFRTKVYWNAEETRFKVIPIVEDIRNKVNQRLEELKPRAVSYMEELSKIALPRLQKKAQDLVENGLRYREELLDNLLSLLNTIKAEITD